MSTVSTSARIDLFWSFRSPYSWLAVERMRAVARDFEADVRFRPVYPLAVREAGWFETARPQWLPYLLTDVLREAERLGVPISMPDPDPIDMDMQTGKVAPDQPKIDRLMRLGQAAAEAGQGLAFAAEVGALVWSGAVKGWDRGDHLAGAAARAGLDLADLERTVAAETPRLDAAIVENETEQRKHHWGVPLMVLDGEPFYGQDRIEALRWRLEKLGLSRA